MHGLKWDIHVCRCECGVGLCAQKCVNKDPINQIELISNLYQSAKNIVCNILELYVKCKHNHIIAAQTVRDIIHAMKKF